MTALDLLRDDLRLPERGHELSLIDTILGKDHRFGRCIDVGAHTGTWTIPLARVSAEVIAYEPHPVARARLIANLHACGIQNVDVRHSPLWREDAQLPFYFRALPSRSGLKRDHPIEPGAAVESCEMLDCTTLDFDVTGPIDFIKVDVEGADAEVLAGAHDLIFTHKPSILVESHGRDLMFGSKDYWHTFYGEDRKLIVQQLEYGASKYYFVHLFRRGK